MTLQEFKAWFSGYTEAMNGPPNATQWDTSGAPSISFTRALGRNESIAG